MDVTILALVVLAACAAGAGAVAASSARASARKAQQLEQVARDAQAAVKWDIRFVAAKDVEERVRVELAATLASVTQLVEQVQAAIQGSAVQRESEMTALAQQIHQHRADLAIELEELRRQLLAVSKTVTNEIEVARDEYARASKQLARARRQESRVEGLRDRQPEPEQEEIPFSSLTPEDLAGVDPAQLPPDQLQTLAELPGAPEHLRAAYRDLLSDELFNGGGGGQ